MLLHVEWHTEIPSYASNLGNAMAPGVEQAAQVIAATARDAVRVDTGSLKETIDVEELSAGPGHADYSVNAGDVTGGYKGGGAFGTREGRAVDYAEAQEYGPGEHTPYMTPAAEAGWQKFVAIMTTRVASTLP